MSRAARRREAARLAAEASAPSLPAAEATWLAAFAPTASPAAQAWGRIAVAVGDVAVRLPQRGGGFQQAVKALTRFLAHTAPVDGPVDPSALLTVARIDAYVAAHVGPNRRARVRGTLLTAARAVGCMPQRPRPTPTQPGLPPYTQHQVAQFVRLCRAQTQPTLRRRLRALVGLGLGAGLRPLETNLVRAGDLSRAVGGGWDLQVRGRWARRVPVRDRYVGLVVQGFDGVAAGELVVARRGGGGWLYQLNVPGAGATPDPYRLRVTWLADLVEAGVPLAPLCRAAGLADPRPVVQAWQARQDQSG